MADYGKALSSASELEDCTATDLLARTLYGEARGESTKGKKGVAWVVRNRVKYNGEWGSTYKKVLLNGGFDGLKSSSGLKPDTSSTAWKTCLKIAKNIKDASSDDNPIGTCLWFNTTECYDNVLKKNDGKYKFGNGTPRKVVESVVLGNHTFFRVSGYDM